MIYFGNQLNKISNNLNMLLNENNIDFDILFNQISNICFDENNFQITPFPSIITQLKNSKYFEILNSLEKIQFPILLGNIDKKNIYNRIEKYYYKIELDLVLIFKEDEKFYYIYDSDVAPYLKLSKDLIQNNLLNTIIIKPINTPISFNKEKSIKNNIKNIYSDNLIGSNAYFELFNVLKNKELSSKQNLSLYYSIRELTILIYKMSVLLKKDKNFYSLFSKELAILGMIINHLTYREQTKLSELFLNLYNNRKEIEKYASEYCAKLSY